MCESCGLIWLNPRPTIEEYTIFYAEEFQNKRRGLETVDEAIKRLKKKDQKEKNEQTLDSIRPYLTSSSRVLEIGSGWGSLLHTIKTEYNCHVEGVEPSSMACAAARKYYGIPVFEGDLESYLQEKNEEKFDIVILIHVFEHLQDPNASLAALKKLLRPGGVIYLAMPDTTRPCEKPEGIFHIGHCYYYTPFTLLCMMIKNKWKPLFFLQDRFDMKMVIALVEDTRNACSYSLPSFAITKEDVYHLLRRYLFRYSFLKGMKKKMFLVVPEAARINFLKYCITILRKLRIINV